MTDKNSKEELAVVIARAKYEIKTFTFTITFTKQMKLAGCILSDLQEKECPIAANQIQR